MAVLRIGRGTGHVCRVKSADSSERMRESSTVQRRAGRVVDKPDHVAYRYRRRPD